MAYQLGARGAKPLHLEKLRGGLSPPLSTVVIGPTCAPARTTKCRGCRCGNPPNDHRYEPMCLLCGKDHLTGGHKCKAKYKHPTLSSDDNGNAECARRLRPPIAAAAPSMTEGRAPVDAMHQDDAAATSDRHSGRAARGAALAPVLPQRLPTPFSQDWQQVVDPCHPRRCSQKRNSIRPP